MDMTFAQIAEALAKRENKYLNMLNSSTTKEARNTAQRMLDRVRQRKEGLVMENRAMTEPPAGAEAVPQFGGGTEVPQYRSLLAKMLGIEAEPGYNQRTRSIGNWFMRNSSPAVTWDDVPTQPEAPISIKSTKSSTPATKSAMITAKLTSAQKPATKVIASKEAVSAGQKSEPAYGIGLTSTPYRIFESTYTEPKGIESGNIFLSTPERELLWNGELPVKPKGSGSGVVATSASNPAASVTMPTYYPNIIRESMNRIPGMAGNPQGFDTRYLTGKAPDDPNAGLEGLTIGLQEPSAFTPVDAVASNPTFGDKLGKAMPGIMQTAGIMGNFLDNFANRRMINKLQGPATPVYTPGVKLNTNYDINPQLRDAREAEVAVGRGIDNTTTSSGGASAAKIAAFTQRLRNTGQLYSQKANAETQMRNHESMLNWQNTARNTAVGNDYNQRTIDFNNAKQGMIAGNTANFGQDLVNINSAYQRRQDERASLDAMLPYLNKYDMFRKYFPQYFPA